MTDFRITISRITNHRFRKLHLQMISAHTPHVLYASSPPVQRKFLTVSLKGMQTNDPTVFESFGNNMLPLYEDKAKLPGKQDTIPWDRLHAKTYRCLWDTRQCSLCRISSQPLFIGCCQLRFRSSNVLRRSRTKRWKRERSKEKQKPCEENTYNVWCPMRKVKSSTLNTMYSIRKFENISKKRKIWKRVALLCSFEHDSQKG